MQSNERQHAPLGLEVNAMVLSELLADLSCPTLSVDPVIYGISLDSRQITSGDLFIAYCGSHTDSRPFIEDALAQGAVAVLAECDASPAILTETGMKIEHRLGCPIVYIEDLSHKISQIAGQFYAHPSAQLFTVGFTGTNGKTTTSYLFAQSLQRVKQKSVCGLIGTLGMGHPGKLVQRDPLTTPDPVTLQSYLAQFRDEGVEAVAMEVSSHALCQGRAQGVLFDTAVLTQISEDHIDSYHGSRAAYIEAKKRLFSFESLHSIVVNLDDEVGYTLACEAVKTKAVYGYSLEKRPMLAGVIHVHAQSCQTLSNGLNLTVVTSQGESVSIHSSLMGRFNAYNILAVLATLMSMGITVEQAAAALSKPATIPGRMERYGGEHHPTVIVDYAHTETALEEVLTSLRQHCRGKIWCVVGCGGERDRKKRPKMAAVAERLSDRLILTDDNPRKEDPEQIISDMMGGLTCHWAVEVEHNRMVAIANAIHQAEKDDIVLVAGKGHERYQLIGCESRPFSDAEQVKLQLSVVSMRESVED